MHILIVEDDALVGETLAALLSTLGHSVLVANNGHEGIAYFEAKQPTIDAVILDMRMMPLSGKEIFMRLKSIQPDVKVFLSTGYVEDKVIEELTKQGLVGVIPKPYRLSELKQALNKLST
jgi:CheY-like chemotaxis protein